MTVEIKEHRPYPRSAIGRFASAVTDEDILMKIVDEVMTKQVEVVTPQTRLYHAAQKMADHDIGFLAVCEGDRLVGCLTDRDLTLRVVARGLDTREKRVHDVMTRNVLTIERGDKLQKAYQLLSSHRIRRLVVVDQNGLPIGIVSLGDLAAKTDSRGFGDIGKIYHDLTRELAS